MTSVCRPHRAGSGGSWGGPTPHKLGLDGYGREILIEKEGHLGRPDIWYWLDKQGIWRRHERIGFTINITRLVRGP